MRVRKSGGDIADEGNNFGDTGVGGIFDDVLLGVEVGMGDFSCNCEFFIS